MAPGLRHRGGTFEPFDHLERSRTERLTINVDQEYLQMVVGFGVHPASKPGQTNDRWMVNTKHLFDTYPRDR